MTLKEFNKLTKSKAKEQLLNCCASKKWAELMMKQFPFKSENLLVDNATRIWYEECRLEDWEEALKHHPKIGDIISLTKKFADAAAKLAGEEQSGVSEASLDVVR